MLSIALSRRDGNKAFTDIGEVTSEVAEKTKKATGIDVSGFVHAVDESAIRHIFEKHGNEKSEALRGQVAVTNEDIESIADVLMSPDNIEQGKKNNTIELSKRIGNEVFVVQEIRVGRKKLAIVTMWKKPLAAHDAPLKESPAETSKTDDKQASSVGSISENKSQAKENLSTALRTQLDRVFGQGWFARLMATGKFVIISRAEAKALGANPNAQAFFNPKDDTTYFVADNIDTRTNLAKLMLHEIGVHALQLGKDNAEFKAILQQVKNLTEQPNPSKAVRAAIKAAKDANTPADLFLEEVAGYLVEHHADLNVSQKIIAWFKKAVRAIGKTLPSLERQKFFQWANTLNEADIVTLASAALRNAPDSLLFDGDVRGGIRNSKGQLLAPNGKPSNLNAMQHAQVRTPEFKAWFGDWEKQVQKDFLSKEPIISLSGNEFQKASTPITERVSQWFKEAYQGKVVNSVIGEVLLNERGVKDSISHGLGKNKAAAFAAVPEIIKNGMIISVDENWKGRGYNGYTLAAPISIGGNDFIGVVIVHRDEQTQRFYLQEVVLKEKLQRDKSFKTEALTDTSVALNGDKHAGAIASLLQSIFNVNASKVVDENGEPLVVYHGTGADFSEFKNEKIGENFAESELGFYFTNHPKADMNKDWYMGTNASEYANNAAGSPSVMAVFLNITHPVEIDSDGWDSAVSSVDIQKNDIKRWSNEKANDGVRTFAILPFKCIL
ncbi:MAG: hypothetical protein QX189_10815 [Methylococcales bacterium]